MARARNLVVLILALAVAGLVSAACDSGTQEPEAPADARVAVPNAEDSQRAPDQIDPSRFPELVEGVVAAVPEVFPGNLPLYPGAVPAQGKGAVIEGAPMAAVQLLSNDEPAVVHKFYGGKLAEDGWTLEEVPELTRNNVISATKDKCKASILVAPVDAGGGGSDIFLIVECSA